MSHQLSVSNNQGYEAHKNTNKVFSAIYFLLGYFYLFLLRITRLRAAQIISV